MPNRPYWSDFMIEQSQHEYFVSLMDAVKKQRDRDINIYPKEDDVYRAFEFVDLDKIKVVILGQDPYHGPDQAQGLAFSVDQQLKIPPSLRNIYKELATDVAGFVVPQHGDLSGWAEQGVLLLNTVLTVEQGKPNSHAKFGWECFSDALLDRVNSINPHCVFMLWGAHAQRKGQRIDTEKHLVLEAAHPSPLSAYRGFFGCKHFSQANQWLLSKKRPAIDWGVPDRGSLHLF